jgi:hypothetical protein
MPVYQYEGVHYELPDGLTNEQAISKIESHLGKNTQKAGVGTGIKSSFANVGNMADTAFSTLAGGAAALFGDEKAAVDIEQQMRERNKSREEWANPEGKEISGTGKLAGAVATLPMQILGMGLSPADTALKAKDAGETNTKALQAAGIDAAGNIAGMMLPGYKQGSMLTRAATGFGANAAQDAATKAAIQGILETEKGQKIFAPTWEDALISGVIGAGSAAALGKGKNRVSEERAKIKALIEKQKVIDSAKAVETPAPELKNLSSLEDETGQMSLFDQPDMVQNRQPYQAEFGDWRIDENGMPIKADLSMELQNLQQPLQRNLWGDELAPKSEQEAFPLTQAIDEMPDAPWRNERDEGLDLLRGEIAAPGELKSAVMEANGPKIPFNFKKQGGGIKIDWSSDEGNKKLDSILKLLPKEYKEYVGQVKKSFADRNAETLEWARFLEEVIPSRETINMYSYDAFKDSTTAKKALDRDIAEKYGGVCIRTKVGEANVVGGIIEEVRTVITKNGDKMVFLKIADLTDSIEAVAFPKIFEEFQDILIPESCIVIKGTFSTRNAGKSILIDKVKLME